MTASSKAGGGEPGSMWTLLDSILHCHAVSWCDCEHRRRRCRFEARMSAMQSPCPQCHCQRWPNLRPAETENQPEPRSFRCLNALTITDDRELFLLTFFTLYDGQRREEPSITTANSALTVSHLSTSTEHKHWTSELCVSVVISRLHCVNSYVVFYRVEGVSDITGRQINPVHKENIMTLQISHGW